MLASKGRMIRVDISKSLKFASLTPDSQRLFVMIIPHLNSYGKMEGQPAFIQGKCVPLLTDMTVKKIEKCLTEISAKTNMKWFNHEGLSYIHCLSWEEHQEFRNGKRGPDGMPTYSRTTPGLLPEQSGASTAINKKDKVEVKVEVKDKYKR